MPWETKLTTFIHQLSGYSHSLRPLSPPFFIHSHVLSNFSYFLCHIYLFKTWNIVCVPCPRRCHLITQSCVLLKHPICRNSTSEKIKQVYVKLQSPNLHWERATQRDKTRLFQLQSTQLSTLQVCVSMVDYNWSNLQNHPLSPYNTQFWVSTILLGCPTLYIHLFPNNIAF